jgi:Na+/serine symporter
LRQDLVSGLRNGHNQVTTLVVEFAPLLGIVGGVTEGLNSFVIKTLHRVKLLSGRNAIWDIS